MPEARRKLLKAGIPVYPGVEAASKAIGKLIGYHEPAERKKVNQQGRLCALKE